MHDTKFMHEGVTGGDTASEETNLEAARKLHSDLGFDPDHSVGFSL